MTHDCFVCPTVAIRNGPILNYTLYTEVLIAICQSKLEWMNYTNKCSCYIHKDKVMMIMNLYFPHLPCVCEKCDPVLHSGATPLLRGCSRKNIFCQKIFNNFFIFQATEMVLTSKWGRINKKFKSELELIILFCGH